MDLSNEDTAGNSSDNTSKLRLKRLYYEILDILQELKDRFSNNGELLGALEAAENLSLNADDDKYFEKIGVEIPSPEEITVARNLC